MTEHYIIKSDTTGRALKVTYKNGKFFRLEHTKGKKFTAAEMPQIGLAIPATTADIAAYQAMFKTLDYALEVKQVSQYQKYVSAWHNFYQEQFNMPPRFNAVDGKHINQIKAHLTRISTENQEGLELFNLILSNWHKLDDFHKENTDIKYINSRLNVILNEIKKAGQAGTGGTNNSVGF